MIPHTSGSAPLDDSDWGGQNRSVNFLTHRPSRRGIGVIVAAATGTTARISKYMIINLPDTEFQILE